MKKLFFILISIFLFYGCQKDNETFKQASVSVAEPRSKVASVVAWHNLTQAQRNQAILTRAYQNNGQYVNMNCKQWASRVVLDASASCVTLPLTNINDWYWEASPNVSGRSGLLQYAVPGEIVQMKVISSNGPHTAIVYSITSTQVTFIESNWCKPPCNIVNLRTLTFTTFYGQVSNYTIYKIL